MANTPDVTLSMGLTVEDAITKATALQEAVEEIFKAGEGKQGSDAFQQKLVQLSNLYDKSKEVSNELSKIGTQPTAEMLGATNGLFIATENLAKAREELKQLTKQVNDLRAQGKAFAPTREFEALTDRIRFLQAELNGSKLLMQEFSEGASKGSESAARAFKKEEVNAARLSAELSQLKTVQEQMQAAGLDKETTASDEFRKVAGNALDARNRVEELEKEIKDLNAEIARLKAEGKDAIPVNDADYKDKLNELNNINNRMSTILRQANPGDILQKSFGKSIVDIANHLSQLPHMVENAMDAVARTLPPYVQVIYSVVKAAVKTIVGYIYNEIRAGFTALANIIKSGFTKAVNTATTAVKALVRELLKLTGTAILSPLKKLGTAISNIGKQANTSAPSLKQIGRAFIQYGLGARSLYRLINKLRTALFEGFADLATVDQPFNAAMSSIISSLGYLRNAFASAFAPIIQAVAPALSTFINMVAQAVTWVGQLIALLTGQPFMIAVPTFKSYADSTNAGAAAAKKAAKAEKGRAKALKDTAKEMRTIAGFDDVEILKAPDDKSGSGGSGGGGGGGGGGGTGLAFQAAPMSEGLLKFAELLKKVWKTGNAYDLGRLFGKKLGDLLRAFNKRVPAIEKVTTKLAKILGSFLAGVLSVNDTFKVLGVAIGNVINLIFRTIRAFLDEFIKYDGFINLGRDIYYTIVNALAKISWDDIYAVFRDLGTGIAQVLNETVAKPDFWIGIFNALANALRAVLIRLIAFSTTLHWDEVGLAIAQGIISFIQNFPKEEAIQAISTFLGGLWTMFRNFVTGMEGHWEEIGTLVAQFIIGLFEDFDPVEFAHGVIAFLDGLWDSFMAFVNTPGWDQVVEKIQQAIITFAEDFQWEGKVDGLITFLNNAIGALVKILDKLDLPTLFDEVYNELKESEEFQKLCDNIVQLFIDFLKMKIKLKMLEFTAIGDSIIRFISGGQIDGMSELAQQAADAQYDATNGAVKGYNKDYQNIGSDGIANPIAKGMGSKSSDIVGVASDISDDIIKTMEKADYKGTGTDNMQDYNKGIDSQSGTIHNTVTGIQDDALTALKSGDTVFIGTEKASGYNKGLVGFRPKIKGSAKAIATDVSTNFNSVDANGAGTKVARNYGTGISRNGYVAKNAAQSLKTGVYNALNSGHWSNIGTNIVNGIQRGLRNGWSWLKNTVHNMAVSLYNSACNALGIHSPSRLFEDKVGAMIPAGIEVGIDKNLSTATTAIENLTGSMISAASNIKLPPIAMGEIIPYNANVDRNANDQLTTLQNVLDMLQSLESTMITRDELNDILADLMRRFPINLYIGDEQVARHANAGNARLNMRFNSI